MITRPLPPLALLSVFALAGCAAGGTSETLAPVPFAALPGWASADQSGAFAQFRRQCAVLSALPRDEDLGGTGLLASSAGVAGDDRPACLAARQATVTDAAEARRFFETWFAPYRADDLALAGYFDPEFAGSLTPSAAFPTPIYARPADLVTVPSPDGHGVVGGRDANGAVVPYDTRAAIDAGALDGRARVLAYLRDRVDLYLLQKEGAGRIRLPDGSVLRLGYAGQNGRKPVPISDALIAHGLLAADDTSAAAIRASLADHPAEAAPLIDQDPSYVFFRVLDGADADLGPPGTLGVNLAALRSLAVDRRAIPLGVPVFLETSDPLDGRPLDVLAFAEDESGDVSGDGRADLFFGNGEAAGRAARAMRASATAFILLPRPAPGDDAREGAALPAPAG